MLVGDDDGEAREVALSECGKLLEQLPEQRTKVVENEPASAMLDGDAFQQDVEFLWWGGSGRLGRRGSGARPARRAEPCVA
ncbi:hypothetical protein AD006_29935 (plasmid) [Pseudonocardia sp. EC080610-09]|nr:hypothetical protein AD006_29935 [Pseudonocardia sp. EC080610-09]